jgi:hypothetical protein
VPSSAILGRERRSKRSAGAVEAGLGGADGTADHLRDELEGIALEVVKDEDRPLVNREPSERSSQRVPAGEGGARIGARIQQRIGAYRSAPFGRARSCIRDRDEPDLTYAPDGMVGGMNEDRPEPGLEGIRIAEPREISPDEHERLLDDLVSVDAVASDRPNESPRAIEPPRNELGERFCVTLLRSLDETALAVVFGHY